MSTIDEFKVSLYVGEITNQIEFAQIAGAQYEAALAHLQDGPSALAKVFFALQAFLGAAAMVSKILWPTQGDASRGQALRQILLDENREYVLRNKVVRNHLEHFDEKLDKYLKSNSVVFDRFISPLGMNSFNGQEPSYLRHVDPDQHVVSILGNKVVLNAYTGELQEIYDRACDWLETYRNRKSTEA